MTCGHRPAAGKTTLASGLVRKLQAVGADVEFVEEDIMINDTGLAELARQFRERRFPGPNELLAGWAYVLSSRAHHDWIINDGSWLSAAEDLPWAQASEEALVDYARSLLKLSAAHSPTLFFVEVPAAIQCARGEQREGAERWNRWLGYVRALPAMASVRASSDEEVVATYGRRFRALWEHAGADLVTLDGAQSPPDVLKAATTYLGIAQ